MKTEHMIVGGLFLLMLVPRRRVSTGQPAVNLNDPTNWGADQWARLYGADMALYGQRPAPSAYDNYSGYYGTTTGFNAPVGGP